MAVKVFESAQGKFLMVMDLDGSVDISAVPELEAKIKTVEEKGFRFLILKLRDLEFMSSAGWGVFIAVKHRLMEKGGDLVVAEMHANVQRVYDLMGIEAMIKSYPTQGAAVADFSGRGS